ncbi:hypothetical protein ACPCIR_16765 [Mycobacterium sp. NPDC051198]
MARLPSGSGAGGVDGPAVYAAVIAAHRDELATYPPLPPPQAVVDRLTRLERGEVVEVPDYLVPPAAVPPRVPNGTILFGGVEALQTLMLTVDPVRGVVGQRDQTPADIVDEYDL